MKTILISLILLSFLNADETQRIESIIEDISELRSDYEECKKSLKDTKTPSPSAIRSENNSYEKLYKKEKKSNISLQETNEKLYVQIKKLKKELNSYDELFKKRSAKKTVGKSLVCKDDNIFPKLIMKKEYEGRVQTFKAASFHLLTDSIIYDAINGNNIDKWDKYTSFTSTQKTNKWIKVSGYFVNKKWTSAKQDMWIKLAKVSKK